MTKFKSKNIETNAIHAGRIDDKHLVHWRRLYTKPRLLYLTMRSKVVNGLPVKVKGIFIRVWGTQQPVS
jgi:hypothetical protein